MFIINCTIVLLINTQLQIQKNFIVLLYKKGRNVYEIQAHEHAA